MDIFSRKVIPSHVKIGDDDRLRDQVSGHMVPWNLRILVDDQKYFSVPRNILKPLCHPRFLRSKPVIVQAALGHQSCISPRDLS